jgi:hypothetical protein
LVGPMSGALSYQRCETGKVVPEFIGGPRWFLGVAMTLWKA